MFSSDEELISAYLDDELSAEERVRAEQLLTERADLRRLLEELRSVREGLQSLPAYALGDDFSSLVLKRAEREVLKDGADSSSSSTAARANADESISPAKGSAGDARSGYGGNGDYRHSWRPLGWAIAALAAAIALTVVQRAWIADRRDEVAMNRAAKDAAAGNAAAPKVDAVATTAAPGAPPVEPLRKESGSGPMLAIADAAKGDAAKKEENIAGADRRSGAFGGDAMRGLNLPAAAAPVAAVPTEAEGLARRNAATMSKAGPSLGTAAGNIASNDAESTKLPVAEIAQADFNRAATIVSQLRSLKNESQIARVPAAQLQQRLAVVEESRLYERSNVAGDLAPQSPTGPQSQTVQTPRPAAKVAAGERAKLGDDKSDGAAVAGRPAEDQLREQTEKRTFAEQQLIPSQLGGNVIVVYVDGTREALDKVLVPTLQMQQIADFNNSWQPQALALAATNTYTGVLDSIVPPTFVSNAGAPSLREPTSQQLASGQPVSGQRGDLAKPGGTQADFNGRTGEKKQGEKAADGRQAFSDESSTGGEEEYFYLVCPTDKLEATLSTLKSQPQYVLNLRCEPGPTTPQEEQRWLAYNRDGVNQGGFGQQSTGKLAGELSASAAVQGPPAADYSGQTIVRGGGSATTTSPANSSGGAVEATAVNGGILIGSAAVAKASSGTLNLSGAAGVNGLGISTQAPHNNSVNDFAVDNKLPVVGLALQQQSAQPSRAQRLTSQQVVALESIAGSQAARSQAVMGQGYESATRSQQFQQQHGGQMPASAAANVQTAQQADTIVKSGVAKDDGETRSTPDKIVGKSNADADSYKSKSMNEATPSKSADSPVAAPAPATPSPAAAPSQAAIVQTHPTAATQAVQQAVPSQMARQRGVAAAGEGFSLSLSQTSPQLPADYREAIFVFRVIDSPAAEVAAPADAKPSTKAPTPADTSPTPTKPTDTAPAIKKAG
jgi:hypothetical protein